MRRAMADRMVKSLAGESWSAARKQAATEMQRLRAKATETRVDRQAREFAGCCWAQSDQQALWDRLSLCYSEGIM